MNVRNAIKLLTQAALLGCVGAMLMLWQIPYPGAPWLKIDASDVPVLIGGFALGPWAGLVVLFIKNFMFCILRFSQDELLGMPMNLLATASMLFVSSWIYHRNKSWQNALLALTAGITCSMALMALANYFVLPVYLRLFAPHIPVPGGRELSGVILATILPFNGVKGLLNGILTFLIYKRVSSFLKPEALPEMAPPPAKAAAQVKS
jgi:riboflavin transporter FmnP